MLDRPKVSIFITLLVFAAFGWGLAKDNVTQWIENFKIRFHSARAVDAAPSPQAASLDAGLQNPALQTPGLKSLEGTAPAGAMPPARRTLPSGAALPSFPERRRPPAENLAQTLGSLNPGAPTEEQISRRNAYFEKLSQQLQEYRAKEAVAMPTVPTVENPPDALPPGLAQPAPGLEQPEQLPPNPEMMPPQEMPEDPSGQDMGEANMQPLMR